MLQAVHLPLRPVKKSDSAIRGKNLSVHHSRWQVALSVCQRFLISAFRSSVRLLNEGRSWQISLKAIWISLYGILPFWFICLVSDSCDLQCIVSVSVSEETQPSYSYF